MATAVGGSRFAFHAGLLRQGSRPPAFLIIPILLLASATCAQPGANRPDATEPVATALDPAAVYEVIDLGTLGGAASVPTAIDSLGRVIGWSHDHHGRMLAFLWDERMRALQTPDRRASTAAVFGPRGIVAGTTWRDGEVNVVFWQGTQTRVVGTVTSPWLKAVNVLGINHRREVIASVDFGDYDLRAMLFGAGAAIDIGRLGRQRLTWALGIDSGGRIAATGFVRDEGAAEITSPALWKEGLLHSLGPLPGAACDGDSLECRDGWARDMNSRGEIVGDINDGAGRRRPFVWRNGHMRDLGAFPGEDAEATLINDRGQILGHHVTSDRSRYFLWSRGTIEYFPRASGMNIVAMNNRGAMTGTHRTANGEYHAFIRHSNGTITDLGPGRAGANYSEPVAINDQGDVIGWSATAGEAPRAVLWRAPRPEAFAGAH